MRCLSSEFQGAGAGVRAATQGGQIGRHRAWKGQTQPPVQDPHPHPRRPDPSPHSPAAVDKQMWPVHTAGRKAVLTGRGLDERAAGGAWRVRSAEDGVGGGRGGRRPVWTELQLGMTEGSGGDGGEGRTTS